MERAVCIHGHFYQPPRENPWLEAIQLQDSAAPYHDWNERITAQCYAPNASARLLDAEGYITAIADNYRQISFDIGPTLLKWLEDAHPEVYDAIMDADAHSRRTRGGHGAAMAQGYNHMVMPLANRRDKVTQVVWGVRDFRHRYGRDPEGMWLPEAAVDLETLDIMAENGIRFTILGPHQAARFRPLGGHAWQDANGTIDTRRPYLLNLPTGRSLAVFFYDHPISQAVAFEDLLEDGEKLARRLADGFGSGNAGDELVSFATDGETFGHHHRFGDMALAYALDYLGKNRLAEVTNYAAYLAGHPPGFEVEITENTSWSCPHGIERWRSDCGCNAGRNPAWHQTWRAPLREAFDWLRDTLAGTYQAVAAPYLRDPWAARDDYIAVVLDRSPEVIRDFMARHAAGAADEAATVTVLKLLELQRHAMLMYTSCGWFFDDLAGIETAQVLQYAGRAVQLAADLGHPEIEAPFLDRLAAARSNVARYGDGRNVWDRFVRSAMVDLPRAAAHFAINSVFERPGEQRRVYCYRIDLENEVSRGAGQRCLSVGRVCVTSAVTLESDTFVFGVLHLGDQNVNAGVMRYTDEAAYRAVVDDLTAAFTADDLAGTLRRLDRHFGAPLATIRDLFRDEQRAVLDRVLEGHLTDIEASFQQIYDTYHPPMRFLAELGHPLPAGFRTAAEFVLDISLRRTLQTIPLDAARLADLLKDVDTWQVKLDDEGLAYLTQQALERLIWLAVAEPDRINRLDDLLAAAKELDHLPFPVDLRKVQNIFYDFMQREYAARRQAAAAGDAAAGTWLERFSALAELLKMRLPGV
jgi:alpha-amylase/alpha-mannosidase (GH57 family)